VRNVLPERLVDDEELSLGLSLVAGAVAACVVLPLTWLFVEAVTIDPSRAASMLFRLGTLEIVFNSLLLMTLVTLFSVLLGVPLAYLTTRTDLPFKRFWSVVVALPLVIPSYLGAFAFDSAFGTNGEFSDLLAPLGVEQVPEISGLSGSVLIITLYTFPYVFLTTRGALLSFDTQLVDAARTLNHDRWGAFRRVTLPHLRPAIAAGALLSALYAVSDFGTPAIMRLPVFTRQIYVEYRSFGQEYAALLSLQLLAVVAAVLALEWWIRPGDDVHSSGAGDAGDRTVTLGKWRWPATLLPASIGLFALVVPVWIFGLWLVRSDGTRPSLAFEWQYAFNSVGVSTGAALVAALAAVPVAYFAARSESPLSTLFERATYVGFAVPGIVLALALVYFGSGLMPGIYQTIPLLVFAYVVRFIPQAVGAIRTSTLQTDPTLFEAARTLGERPVGAFRRAVFPLVLPGIVAGAALVFLTTMKELPITLVLRPTGFETLVTQIWRAERNAFFQYAAVPALVLILVSGLSLLVLLSQEGNEY
jgi:iron(III) transport system permease protein